MISSREDIEKIYSSKEKLQSFDNYQDECVRGVRDTVDNEVPGSTSDVRSSAESAVDCDRAFNGQDAYRRLATSEREYERLLAQCLRIILLRHTCKHGYVDFYAPTESGLVEQLYMQAELTAHSQTVADTMDVPLNFVCES